MTTRTRWDRLYRDGKHFLKWPSEHVVRWATTLDGTGKTALDIGCGAGRHLPVLWETGAEVYGIDTSPAAVAFCDQEYMMDGITVELGDMTKIPHIDGMFDFALAFASFYYGPQELHTAAIRELERVLKPDGQAFVVVRTDRDTRRTGEVMQEEASMGDEAGMLLNFVEEEDIVYLYGRFSKVHWELTETTRHGRQWLDSDWLITATK